MYKRIRPIGLADRQQNPRSRGRRFEPGFVPDNGQVGAEHDAESYSELVQHARSPRLLPVQTEDLRFGLLDGPDRMDPEILNLDVRVSATR